MGNKKLHTLLFTAIIWLLLGSQSLAAESIKIFIDGKQQSYDQQPFMENNRVLVPLRGIFETLGARVDYEEETREIYASKGNSVVWLQVNSNDAKVNGKQVTLDRPALVKEGRTFVPLRFISESLNCFVQWENEERAVIITTPSEPSETPYKVIDEGEPFTDEPVSVEIEGGFDIVIDNEDSNVRKGHGETIIVR